MVRRFFFILLAAAVLCACQRFHIGPKGEGEYVAGSALVPYDEQNPGAMKKRAMKAAELDALEKAARIFLSSSSKIEYPAEIREYILSKPQNYIRRTYFSAGYRKGDGYYAEVRSMVLVSELSAKIKSIQESANIKKTNVYVASRDLALGSVSMKQYCRQGIYQAFKGFPYTLIDGGNLSQNNLDDPASIIDKAKKDGARFVILADASASNIETANQIANSFKPVRGKAALKTVAANNRQTLAETSGAGSGLDAVEEIAVQKALTAACEEAAANALEPINRAVNSSKIFAFTFVGVKTISRLERLQNILQQLREVEDFSLVKYANSNATFEVQANASNIEELAAKIIRKHYSDFSILSTRPDEMEIMFI